jgi:hypothetical protein
MRLRILNEIAPGILQYLPYGVTTIEMKIELDAHTRGILTDSSFSIYTRNRPDSRKEKVYVGYADESKDFLVLWGAGKEEGLEVNKHNIAKRLFLQILHRGLTPSNQTITFCSSQSSDPLQTLKIVPAVEPNSEIARMEIMTQSGNTESISFKGNKIPMYYPRWFPPRPRENKSIEYYNVEVPRLSIKFKSRTEGNSFASVDSDIDIFLDRDKIAEVTGDWRYSWPHAEIFTVYGDAQYIVLRLWLYWIHTYYAKNSFHGKKGMVDNNMNEDEQARRTLWEQFNIECPDNERFDFLIDTDKKKVAYLGTDFHYQESWYKFEGDEFVRARIANDINIIEQLFKKLMDRFNQPKENFNPMTLLKELLRSPKMIRSLTLLESVPSDEGNEGGKMYRPVGFTRKHVPYSVNGNAVAELISSVVTA